jgi:hypothetical protein
MRREELVSRDDLSGVWKRTLLIDGAGNRDDVSEVYWVQSGALCGDIRLHLRHTALADLAVNDGAPFLEAFAGHLSEVAGTFRWQPSICSFREERPPDEGRLSWVGDELREDGVHVAYEERWQRIETSSTSDFALELQHPEKDVRGFVLQVGTYVFHGRGGSGAADSETEFSLFETGTDGPRLVLSTIDSAAATCPAVEFGGAEAQTVQLTLRAPLEDGPPQRWRVTSLERPDPVSTNSNTPDSIVGTRP